MSGGNGTAQTGADASLPTSFDVLAEVPLRHLPNDAKFVVQRQRGGAVPPNAVQFYLAWKWKSADGKDVWRGGGSVQAEQVSEMIDALDKAYKAATGKSPSKATGTFADLLVDDDDVDGGGGSSSSASKGGA